MTVRKVGLNGISRYFVAELGLSSPHSVSYDFNGLAGVGGSSYLQKPVISPISEILKKAPEITAPLEISAKSHSVLCNLPHKADSPSITKYIEKHYQNLGVMEKIIGMESRLSEISEEYIVEMKKIEEAEKSGKKKCWLIIGKKKKTDENKKESIIKKAVADFNAKQEELKKAASTSLKYEFDSGLSSLSDIVVQANYSSRDFYSYRNMDTNRGLGWFDAKLSATLFPESDVPQDLKTHPLVEGLSRHENLAEVSVSFGGLQIKKNSSDYYEILAEKNSQIDEKILEDAKGFLIAE